MDANATNYNADATNKAMTNGATYNVYMLHVMTFQSMDVFIRMDLEHSMKDLMLQHAHHMVEYLVKVIACDVWMYGPNASTINEACNMWMMVLVSIVMHQLIGMLL